MNEANIANQASFDRDGLCCETRTVYNDEKAETGGMVPLVPGYQPNAFDVICARGNKAKKHAGNVRFRRIIKERFRSYDNAPTKVDKSVIVLGILREIQDKSPDGGFIKKVDGQWYSVGDNSAREKIGQSLRDLLHTKYSSSTQAKRRKKQMMESKASIPKRTLEENQSAANTMGQRRRLQRETFQQPNISVVQQGASQPLDETPSYNQVALSSRRIGEQPHISSRTSSSQGTEYHPEYTTPQAASFMDESDFNAEPIPLDRATSGYSGMHLRRGSFIAEMESVFLDLEDSEDDSSADSTSDDSDYKPHAL